MSGCWCLNRCAVRSHSQCRKRHNNPGLVREQHTTQTATATPQAISPLRHANSLTDNGPFHYNQGLQELMVNGDVLFNTIPEGRYNERHSFRSNRWKREVYSRIIHELDNRQGKRLTALSVLFVELVGGKSAQTAPFPPEAVDGLVSEGIEQKAIATMVSNANRAGRAVDVRARVEAYTLVTSRREEFSRVRLSEVV